MKNYSSKQINEKIVDIQTQWADGIVEIGKAYLDKKDYIESAEKFIDNLYYFQNDKILFKPTKASHKQFRIKKDEFISYFIGHNKVSEEDTGFALEPWKNIHFENFDYTVFENILLTMGNYFFTNYDNENIKVEYSFGYTFDDKENLKIVFHHSSIPYQI